MGDIEWEKKNERHRMGETEQEQQNEVSTVQFSLVQFSLVQDRLSHDRVAVGQNGYENVSFIEVIWLD